MLLSPHTSPNQIDLALQTNRVALKNILNNPLRKRENLRSARPTIIDQNQGLVRMHPACAEPLSLPSRLVNQPASRHFNPLRIDEIRRHLRVFFGERLVMFFENNGILEKTPAIADFSQIKKLRLTNRDHRITDVLEGRRVDILGGQRTLDGTVAGIEDWSFRKPKTHRHNHIFAL